jgi:hypothetical protein
VGTLLAQRRARSESVKTRSIIASVLLGAALLRPALATGNAPPRIDLSVDGAGRVWGWTYDPDDPGRSLDVRFYVDGDAASGTLTETQRADRPRDDVRAAFGIAGDHGFEWRIPVWLRDGRSHSLFAYAQDASGGAPMLYPFPKSFQLAADVRGNLDGVKDGFVWGWAALVQDPNATATVHLYVDGDEAHGVDEGALATTFERDDVNAALGASGTHGFGLSLPDALRDGLSHELRVYVAGSTGTELLGKVAFTWGMPATPPTPSPSPTPSTAPAATRVTRTWSPGLRSDRHAFYLPAPVWLTTPEGSDPGPGMWTFGTTNETAAFGGGTMNDMLPGDPSWAESFHPLGDGRYQVGLVVDKVNFPNYLDRYSFAGFSDAFDVNTYLAKPTLGEDLYVDVKVALHAQEAHFDPSAGDAKVRVMVGATVRWNGVARFMEVNLCRSSNFDLVDAQSNVGGPGGRLDPLGIYDRLANWGSGELVYYDGTQLDRVPGLTLAALPHLDPDAQWRSYTIPVSRLVRAFSWDQAPADWHDATIAGIYIGIEVWGRGRMWIELTDYDLYALVP